MASFSPTRPNNNSSVVSRNVSPASFSQSFQGGNYKDSGLSSMKRKEDLLERTKLRKQISLVERAKMKQQLMKIEEVKRQRRYKIRELKKRQTLKEIDMAITIQRYYRGFKTRRFLAIKAYEHKKISVKRIIRCYRTYCLVRIAKADRGVLDKIRSEDNAIRLVQEKIRLWKLRIDAYTKVSKLREIREAERLEFIRQLREKACTYIQRVIRGILGRSKVVKMAVEKQVMQAQTRVDQLTTDDEGKQSKIVAQRNKYRAAAKTPSSRRSQMGGVVSH